MCNGDTHSEDREINRNVCRQFFVFVVATTSPGRSLQYPVRPGRVKGGGATDQSVSSLVGLRMKYLWGAFQKVPFNLFALSNFDRSHIRQPFSVSVDLFPEQCQDLRSLLCYWSGLGDLPCFIIRLVIKRSYCVSYSTLAERERRVEKGMKRFTSHHKVLYCLKWKCLCTKTRESGFWSMDYKQRVLCEFSVPGRCSRTVTRFAGHQLLLVRELARDRLYSHCYLGATC